MPLRLPLPEATLEIHERRHRQDGFAAIYNFTRDIEEYRRLLVRSCGFYVPHEPDAAVVRDRRVRLEDNLYALGIHKRTIVAAPRYSNIPCLSSAEASAGGALCQ